MAAQINADGADFIFSHIHDAPEQQLKDADSLDAKTVQLFSAASLIIGLAGLSGARGPQSAGFWLGLAVLAYIAVGLTAFFHLRVREFHRSLQADELWARGWNKTPAEIRQALLDNIEAAYAYNKTVLTDKGRTMRIEVAAVAVEVVLVGAFLIATRL